MTVVDRNPARSCCVCRREWDVPADAGIGWSPTPHGWSCPACSRRRAWHVERAARFLLTRGRWWMDADVHDHRVRCFWSETVRRAREIVLSGTTR
ncbi:MAG: hypothetical protein JWM31_1218 [Solirubrobacterales bacterium]|nr:hypothetical protein [Solirubrobacterales bacterium]